MITTQQSILEKENRFTGGNFTNQYQNLQIVLHQEKKLYIRQELSPYTFGHDVTQEQKDIFNRYLYRGSMSKEIDVPSIITYLLELYNTRTRAKYYEVSNALYDCKLSKGGQIGPYMVKMIDYFKLFTSLGFIIDNKLVIDLLLKSFSKSQINFVMNFNLSEKDKTLEQF